MWAFILDPKFLNYVLMVMYILIAIRWAINGSWGHVAYWVSALVITIVITFGYNN